MIGQRFGGLIMLVISLGYGIAALGIPVLPADALEPMSARTLPLVLSALGLLLGVALWFNGLEVERDVLERITPAAGIRAAGLLGLCAMYGLALEPLGFVVASCGAVTAGLLLMGERRPLLLFGLPILVVGLVWLVLEGLLEVHLAWGSLWH